MKFNPRFISVRLRFFLLITGTVIFWLLAGFILYSMIDRNARLQNIHQSVQYLPAKILEMENALDDFYNMDRYTDEFQEYGKSDLLSHFNEVHHEVYEQLRSLETNSFFTGKPLLLNKTSLLREILMETDLKIQSMIRKTRQRGWNQYGMAGTLFEWINNPESGISGIDSDIMRSLDSELETYLNYPQQQRINVIENLAKNLAGSIGDQETVRVFLTTLENLLKLDRELGNSPFEGLRGQIYDQLHILHEESRAFLTLTDIELEKQNLQMKIGILLTVVISVIVYMLAIWMVNTSVTRPLQMLYIKIRDLANGRFPSSNQNHYRDEFSRISSLLNDYVKNLQEKTRFTVQLAEGKESHNLDALGEKDQLANALIKMEKKIIASKIEDQKHRQSREERRWTNEGIAKFGDILRMHNNQIDALAENVIHELVSYLNASAGGFFLLKSKDDKVYLDLISSFAFDRKKYLKKQFALGEGLVGTCALEKEKILLTDIPDHYINISSGLGESKPRSLIIIPLKFEDQVLGVIEIASISAFRNFEVGFLEILAESIASAVSSVQMNMRTEELLRQSQEQAREMSKQEEIMRQQMEELQTTQEESARRESEISGILNAIHNSSLVAEYNMEEELVNINDRFAMLLELQKPQLIGRKHHEIAGVSRHTDAHKNLWEEIREGKTITQVEKIVVSSGRGIWLRQTFTPILDKDGVPFKVLNIASDITETVEQQESLEKQSLEITRANIEMKTFSDAVDAALIKCIYSASGQILEVNENYEQATGYTEKEMIGKNNRIFLQRLEKEQFEKIWEDILKDKPYKGVIRRTKPTGEEVWIMSSFTPAKDENGNIFKVFYLGQDITERKLKYQLLEEANREIERLRDRLDRKD